jgi:hypothetical protein
MAKAGHIAGASIGSRLDRLPLVLLLMVGLLISLIHCASCDLAFTGTDASTVAMKINHGSAPNVPEQQLPCHSGHCLSHVTTQHIAAVAFPADMIPRAPSFGQQPSPATLAGLLLFKPPRA